MPTQVGNMVEINGTLIPAVNIQVENVPGFLERSDGSKEWYGVYFEIMFEDGALWIVDQGSYEGETKIIYIEEFDRWGQEQDLDNPTDSNMYDDWGQVLDYYQIKVKSLR